MCQEPPPAVVAHPAPVIIDLPWTQNDVNTIVGWCYEGDQSRVPNKAFGHGGRLPKLINIMCNSCNYAKERLKEMYPDHDAALPDNNSKIPDEFKHLIEPIARRVLLAIEQREMTQQPASSASRKRPLEGGVWDLEMKQQEQRNQRQRAAVSMK